MNPPAFKGIDVTYKDRADNKDIRDLLEKLVPKATAQMVTYSKKFQGATELDTCKNIFDFLKNDVRYVADGEQQIIKLPSALLRKKVGDCKSFSLLTASILANLNIPYTFVYASYNSNPIPAHVYVQTQSGIIIDAVYGIFNEEKKANYKYKKNMKVGYMAGINGSCGCGGRCGCNKGMGRITIISKEKRQKALDDAKALRDKALNDAKALRDKAIADAKKVQDKAKSVASKAGQGLKTAGIAPARAMFMLLITQNIDGFASKLSKTNTTDLMNRWKALGGDRTKLTEAIKTGASKRERKLGFLPKLKKLIGNRKISGIGEIPAEINAQIVALCTTLGTSIGGAPQGTTIGASLGGVVVKILPSIMGAISQAPLIGADDALLPADDLTDELIDETDDEDGSEDDKKKGDNTMLYVGGALALAVGIYLATKNK